MIIPSKINKGDEVILIATSRKVDLSALEITEEWLKKQELVPLRGEHILKEEGIFAGTDSERKHDLQWAFDHTTAKVIWCYRGGYGSARLLEDINPSRFLEKPNETNAKRMLKEGNYFWNSGIFMFRAKDMISAFELYAKDI